MRTAWDCIRVWMGCRPAARMVSPDSARRRKAQKARSVSNSPLAHVQSSRRQDEGANGKLTNKIDNTVRHTKRASSLNTSSNILNLRRRLPSNLDINLLEELASHDLERSRDPLTRQLLDRLVPRVDRHLNLERALPKVEREEFGNEVLEAGLDDDVLTGDTEGDGTKGDEAGDVGGREEDTVVAERRWGGRRERERGRKAESRQVQPIAANERQTPPTTSDQDETRTGQWGGSGRGRRRAYALG